MKRLEAIHISIIIPIYKVEQYIERCVKSVIIQTFTDYEVILVDDFSQDNSLKIAEHFLTDNNISFQSIQHTSNQKQGTARNNGLKIAKGKYIFFIDADDELANKNALQLLYTEIEKDTYDFVTAKERHIENGKEKVNIEESNSIAVLRDAEILKALSVNNVTATAWNNLIRKDFLLKNNILFPEEVYFEDIPYSFMLCAMAKKVAVLNKITYLYYFQENENATTSSLNEQKIKDVVLMCKEMLSFAEQNEIYIKVKEKHIYKILSLTIFYILTHPSLVKNKVRWLKTYILFQKMYKASFLFRWKNKLPLPSKLAYIFFKNYFFIKYMYEAIRIRVIRVFSKS